jgi:hypothetical protein
VDPRPLPAEPQPPPLPNGVLPGELVMPVRIYKTYTTITNEHGLWAKIKNGARSINFLLKRNETYTSEKDTVGVHFDDGLSPFLKTRDSKANGWIWVWNNPEHKRIQDKAGFVRTHVLHERYSQYDDILIYPELFKALRVHKNMIARRAASVDGKPLQSFVDFAKFLVQKEFAGYFQRGVSYHVVMDTVRYAYQQKLFEGMHDRATNPEPQQTAENRSNFLPRLGATVTPASRPIG